MEKKGQRRLSDLITGLKLKARTGIVDPVVTGIAMDSRNVKPGEIFVALPGTRVDGHEFIPQALDNGAAVVIGFRSTAEHGERDIVYLQVPDPYRALAAVSAAWYDHPARKLVVIGVTGTDGKTTTVNLIYEILRTAGIPVGMVSTVKAVIGEEGRDTGFHVTTPQALDLQRYLAEMVEVGLTHAVLETTSHGLAQGRVLECAFDLGVVTNITHEHLDFHGSYQEYRRAKASLFRLVAQSPVKDGQAAKLAVLNRDDQSYGYLKQRVGEWGVPEVSYGTHQEADLRGDDLRETAEGLRFNVIHDGHTQEFTSPLSGAYNMSNCLGAAAACVHGLGITLEQAREGVARVGYIPGRMERIDLGQEPTTIVDFAHTPNALRRALESVGELSEGRVIAVFGSAGLRDRAKRNLMAEIAGQRADLTVLTAEDPRTEDLDEILEEMAAGLKTEGGVEGETYWKVPDRGNAIRKALELAGPEDLVIVCGKGHEQSMCFGETEYPWDDRQAVQAALAEMLGVEGPSMPYLPTQE